MIFVVILPPDLNDLPGANTLTFPHVHSGIPRVRGPFPARTADLMNRQTAVCNQDVLPQGLSDNRHGEIGDDTADDVFQPSQRQIVITPFVPQQGKRNLRCDHRNGTAT